MCVALGEVVKVTVKQKQGGAHLAAARELALRIAVVADRIDRERELPRELADEIADGGFFRQLVPLSLGGGEIDYLEHLSIVQTKGGITKGRETPPPCPSPHEGPRSRTVPLPREEKRWM